MMDARAFQEPWHAQVVGLAKLLTAEGHIDPVAWSERLGAVRTAQAKAGEPDDETHYHIAVFETLMSLLADKDTSLPGEVRKMTEAWREAYLSTPHGDPVELG